MPISVERKREAAFLDPWNILTPIGSIDTFTRSAVLGVYSVTATGFSTDFLFPFIENFQYLPRVPWIPRWLEANYSSSSTLRKFYGITLANQNDLFHRFTQSIVPKFFGEISEERVLYFAKYIQPKSYVPTVVLASGAVEIPLVYKDSMGSLLSEKLSPSFTITDKGIYFKNLAIVSYVVDGSSGYIDIAPIVAFDPPIADSLIIITDPFNDTIYLDAKDNRIVGNKIYLGLSGTYVVSFLSDINHANVLAEAIYLKIDGQKIFLEPSYIENTWDTFAKYNQLKRNKTETNVTLQARNHFITVANTVEERIAASLGKGVAILWGTDDTPYTLPSGTVDFNVWDQKPTVYLTEQPTKYGNNWYLLNIPDLVEVRVNNTILQTTEYSVSGNIIISLSDRLINAHQEDVSVRYSRVVYTKSSTTVSQSSSLKKHFNMVCFSKVQVQEVSKRIRKWYWEKEEGITVGGSTFN